MTMAIMIASAIIAFAVTNIYYQYYLKTENDQKVTQIAENIVTVFEKDTSQDLSAYLLSMADLGYKFYVVDEHGEGKVYGEDFRSYHLESTYIDQVFSGEIYHGIANFPWKLFVTGFFDNELRNTIGVPIEVNGEVNALFVRPNTPQQFGEMRTFLAMLLIFILLFSFLLILISTTFIVNPVKKLTEATRKIAAGNYHIKLNVKRDDEIGRLARDFSKMSDQLEQTEEQRQEFVASVSHEIQSPLTSIQGFSLALREQDLSEEERIHYLSIIEKESKRLSMLSKQLLTLSFLDSEIDNHEKIAFNIRDQLREIVATTEWLWREREVVIEMDVPSIIAYGDPKLLYQVWSNLFTNAIRYNRENGMITIRGIEKQGSIDVIFQDTGMGIAQENLMQLFDRFYKVDKARTRTESSTGLGLSIVKKIIELHDGTIMVESEQNQGSTFTVTLPKRQRIYEEK